MKKLYRLLVLSSLAAVIGGMRDPLVQADDAKVFPGLMCVQRGGGTPVYFNSGIFNASKISLLVVMCPIVRDTTIRPFSKVEVTVMDRSDLANVICAAFIAARGGKSVIVQGGPGKMSTGQGEQTLSFPGDAQWDLGPFWVECTIPPATGDLLGSYSGVGSYFISEP